MTPTVARTELTFGLDTNSYSPTFRSTGGQDATHLGDTGALQNAWHMQYGPSIPSNFTINEHSSSWALDEMLHADLFETSPPVHSPILGVASQCDQSREEQVQNIWFTSRPSDGSTSGPEMPSELTSRMPSPQRSSVEVDEYHRSRLQRRLQIHSFEPRVPSTDFLNACIRLYFSRAHALFPVVHPATFRPSKANAPLTLALCVMGTSFMGSDKSFDVGVRLFERLVKATILYWEKAGSNGGVELVSTIQAAVLSQLFALLSGRSSLLLTADAFHGPPVSWARHQGLFQQQNAVYATSGLSDDDLEKTWREWARNEESIRTTQALGIIDAELARLLHHEPVMRLNCQVLASSCSDRLFMARNAKEWRSDYIAESSQNSSQRNNGLPGTSVLSLDVSKIPCISTLTSCAILEELHMRVAALQVDQQNALSTMPAVHNQLSVFFHHVLSSLRSDQSPTSWLQILWHSVFITMFADINLLEKAIGRDGSPITAEERLQITRWAGSEDAQRAVVHALLIKKLVEPMTVSDEQAIHIPRSLFYSGLVLFCYSKFILPQCKGSLPSSDDSMPEIKLLRQNAALLLVEARDLTPGVLMFHKTLYATTRLLQRMGSWGLSRRFGNILGTVTAEELGHI